MSIKYIAMAFIAVFGAVGVTLTSLITSGPDKTGTADTVHVEMPPRAPRAGVDPFAAVTTNEATRRAILHSGQGDAAKTVGAEAHISRPVITEIRDAKDVTDFIAREVLGALTPATPPPTTDTPQATSPNVMSELPTMTSPDLGRVELPVSPRQPAIVVAEEASEPTPTPRPVFPKDLMDKMRDDLRRKPFDFEYILREVEEGSFFLDEYAVRVADAGLTTSDAFGGQGIHGAISADQTSAARPLHYSIQGDGSVVALTDRVGGKRETPRSGDVLGRAGDVVYASLLYGFNSDDPRGLPVFATILDYSGGRTSALHEARLIGEISYSKEQASIVFTRAILADGSEVGIRAIAVSEATARTGIAQNVDRHYLERYGALFLAGLLQGVGEVGQILLQRDSISGATTIINTGSGTASSETESPSTGEVIAGAVKPVGDNLAAAAATGFSRRPTISAEAGMTFGVVLVETVRRTSEIGQ